MPAPSQELLQTIASHADPSVPLSLLLTIADRESGFVPSKRGAAGEYGLFQLLPKTVREELHYAGALEKLLEPGLNTELATQYLTILKERFGEWPAAVVHWNGSGPAARDYAAGIFQKLPSWDDFVRTNLEFFRRAIASRGGAVGLLAVAAAVVALFLFLRSRRATA